VLTNVALGKRFFPQKQIYLLPPHREEYSSKATFVSTDEVGVYRFGQEKRTPATHVTCHLSQTQVQQSIVQSFFTASDTDSLEETKELGSNTV
jgi:hypothetical protein